ncbi:MAG: EcsC family protein [Bryobacteraceae bacterium]
MAEITSQHLEELRDAVILLESPSFALKVANVIGAPVERVMKSLPESMSVAVHKATSVAIHKALEAALRTMPKRVGRPANRRLHKLSVAAAGGVGGFFGLASLAVELPLSTAIMLRSIADIAQSEGEDLNDPAGQLACLEVFALGGKSASEASSETSYYAIRAALARTVSEAATYLAERGLAVEGAPPMIRLVAQIASRFGLVVSEKVAAELVPLVGAAGGAAVNLMFLHYFQKLAGGHFVVRRLERVYGPAVIEAEYERLRAN